MKSILSFTKSYWKSVLLIVVLLLVQAFCDLSLPVYTSNIVDVGLQNKGLEHVTPTLILRSELDRLELFMPEEEAAEIEAIYTTEGEICRLTNEKDVDFEKTDALFVMPILIASSMGEQINDIPKEAALAIRSQTEENYVSLDESMTSGMAMQYVQTTYTEAGGDLSSLQNQYILKTGGIMIAYALLILAVSIMVGYLASKVSAGVGRGLRNQVFQKVVAFSNTEMDQFSTASLITRSTNDIQQVQMVTVMLLRMVIYAPILGIGGVFRVLMTNVSMAWTIALGVLLIIALVGVLMVVAMPKFKRMQSLVDRLNLVTREILTGLPVIRAFSRERYEEQRFDTANTDLMKTSLFTSRSMSLMVPAMTFIMNGLTVLILWVGANHIDLGDLQVGQMMAFITYSMQIVMSFLMLTMMSIILPRAIVSANRIQEVLHTESTIRDAKDPRHLEVHKGVLVFDHVYFRYPNAEENALEEISFTARPGETTAVIGSTGSGKSTLIQLVPRLYDVTEGRILLDGVDLRDLTLQELREQLGYVPQKGVLFSGSIAENLRYGRQEASDQEIQDSAAIAQAAEFINEKPEGYDTWIAQGGSNVSGGQKQRLSIARAIAKSPQVFLFDDSFSALDYKTDVTLRKALAEKVGNRTVIIVAQRISTILHADQIIVLDSGRIAGIGTHQELLKTCVPYQQIAKSQLSEDELSGVTGKEAAE